MRDLGLGFLQLGFLRRFRISSAREVTYGFLVGFFKRTRILGAGNVLMGVSTILQSVVVSYPQVMAAMLSTFGGYD
jgi:hypothetical protein